ncbi:uncharacterized protein PHALS_15068 [Plasmopara halstedii]|uniref:Uncharacterized protein n=1 Tax=Plasmopara halstedii TaxID=4781 RepID=A0A0P1AAN1_PLAHL|nr:uncharacterized protein PHALS_15068 [Plasmopara halstedii]CEG37359.1 hypothetical protein PHALS_15068 [Plasmopara halstedii]|eukprot:XP_024573728.1 hypothetical protein PHALS_15068 [Plasmopara halstedii]
MLVLQTTVLHSYLYTVYTTARSTAMRQETSSEDAKIDINNDANSVTSGFRHNSKLKILSYFLHPSHASTSGSQGSPIPRAICRRRISIGYGFAVQAIAM